MTLTAHDEHGKTICPQGIKAGLFSIPSERVIVDSGEDSVGNMNGIERQGEEDAALQEEYALINENSAEG